MPRTKTSKSKRPPAVRIRNLIKTFKRRGKGADVITPVNNVTLDVESDDLVVLLGPSGCGKTTLLRCVAGLERPDLGEIEIDGVVVFSSKRGIYVPPEKRGINMIFQSYALWPHMSVFDNVAYPLRSIGKKAPEIRKRVMEVLDAVGLDGLDGQYPSQISGGQQQRVALARAIVALDPVILFDEPLSNVDAKVREQLRNELLSLKKRIRFSALYVTHDQHEAMSLGNKIAVLDSGRIEQYDTPRAIYGKPTNSYVGRFVGAANIVQGKVLHRAGTELVANTSFGQIHATIAVDSAYQPGDGIELLTRPESWRLSAEPGTQANTWRVELQDVLFAGPYSECIVYAAGGALRIWTVAEPMVGPDKVCWATISPEDVHVLGAGERL